MCPNATMILSPLNILQCPRGETFGLLEYRLMTSKSKGGKQSVSYPYRCFVHLFNDVAYKVHFQYLLFVYG